MQSRNIKQISRGYLLFSVGLLMCSSIGVATLYGFIKTTKVEYDKMELRTIEYDNIYARQIELTEKVDSLYNYITLMGDNNTINQILLQNRISTSKMEFVNSLSKLDNRDVLLYNKMHSQINSFLDTKEDIRRVSINENLLKNDLKRCIDDNRVATRKLTLGNIQIER